ncbi:hypothetical protein [Actinoallomurus sp. NPDC052274]|uniref:hypothetical protein n=1 Tax=Actinoallomurus sp. NPDC052274 TaxID=3155420 RepID=UPI0034177212
MGEQLDVTPAGIRRIAGELEKAVDKLDSELEALANDMTGQSDPFGGDDIGSLIGMCYQAIHDMAMDSYSSNVEELDAHVEALHGLANGYETAEYAGKDAATDAGKTVQAAGLEINRVRQVLG